ncbi:MAG TPA: PIN domain-containing protein [Terracidiphilus sp.]|nr:PIN domain-containing protein [Terracidiphilus sp.]
MAILIDADLLIESERGSFDLEEWLRSHRDEEFRLAAITMAELWHGVERATGAHRMRRQRFLERVFALFEPVPYTAFTAFHHARIWAELEAAGRMIGAHDLILAAIAMERGDSVATFNTRHFKSIKSLKVIAP